MLANEVLTTVLQLAAVPLLVLLNHAAFWLCRRCGLQPVSESELVHSEEEIRLILGQDVRQVERRAH